MSHEKSSPSRSPRLSTSAQEPKGFPALEGSGVEPITTKVVGVTFEGRQAVVAKLHMGEQIVLRREPSNPYDANAIRVERLDGEQIGFLNRFLAQELATRFDTLGEPVDGNVINLTGSSFSGYSLGVNISFTIPVPEGGEIIEITSA